jgi:hypothetical protein
MPEGPSAHEKTVAEVNGFAWKFLRFGGYGFRRGYRFDRATHPWEPLVPASLTALVCL